ncbi:histone H1.4-like [Protobothrops mucrosquamatus]|uniref:histone H1.4-like n=1 Tax=Protobothrops mucrosquamatus TaxID=103944 RepID=UPI000775882B|nr:histone H1.4-like [Protobothrops mucrosquamatus]
MAEVAPAAPVAAVPVSKAKRVAGAAAAKVQQRKPGGPSVTELLMQAVAASKERGGISLAALKKSLAASGYDVERNNSRIKLGLKSLVTKGTLLQTKGTGASGSFKLNKKQAEPKVKAAAAAAAVRKRKQQQQPARKPAKKARKAPGAAGPKKSPKKAVKKAPKGVKKPKAAAAAKAKKAAKSPAKARAAKPKAKPKTPKAKVAKPKKGVKK